MEETKKVDWQRLAITIGIVLVTAAAVGGTVWYLMDQNAKSIADSEKKSVASLQAQIDELKSAAVKTTTSETTTQVNADIKSTDFSKLISVNNSTGTWQTTLYADLTGDGQSEAIPSFKVDGTGGMLFVYIYGYNEGKLVQLYKNEDLYMGKLTLAKQGGKEYPKLDWVDLNSTVNKGKPNSDLTVDMHQYIVWNAVKATFMEQESI